MIFEQQLNSEFPSDQKYAFERRSNQMIRTYSTGYSEAYHKELDGMVERQMRAAIHAVSSFWYSAWVDAGKPDLQHLIRTDISEQEKRKVDQEERLFHEGKIIGREESD